MKKISKSVSARILKSSIMSLRKRKSEHETLPKVVRQASGTARFCNIFLRTSTSSNNSSTTASPRIGKAHFMIRTIITKKNNRENISPPFFLDYIGGSTGPYLSD